MPENGSRTALVVGGMSILLAVLVSLSLGASAQPFPSAAASPVATRHDSLPPPASFHHVHLNVVDPQASQTYYEKFFGALPIQYRDLSDALFVERSFLLLNRVDQPARDNFGTTLWHIGWAGVDGHSEFEWRVRDGIEVQTPITPLGNQFYMYFWGPDRELVEVYTGSRNHRFEHVHLLATDLEATLDWFSRYLGVRPARGSRPLSGTSMLINTIRIDNVNLIIFEVPGDPAERVGILPDSIGPHFAPTEGRAMDHVAFSYPHIAPELDRMRAAGVQVVRPITTDPETGLTSFFVRGPDNLLVEIVEERPIPDGIWR
jgi:catechol 2,3-dioxygenase-like lactoylglutathione lyase family enzyme